MKKDLPKKALKKIVTKRENKETVKKDKPVAYKEFEFTRFCLWLSMPIMFRGNTVEELETKYFIDDAEMQELCAIKNQNEFCERYNVHKNTLTVWRARAKETDLFRYVQDWAKKLGKNVVASTYRSAMSRDPKAHQDRKLMLSLGGWNEEQQVNLKGEGLAEFFKRTLDIK